MKRALILIFFLATSIVGAQTTKPTDGYKFYGAGAESCGDWVLHAKSDGSAIHVSEKSWVLGFISGAWFGGFTLVQTDLPAMNLWMDNYCTAHPLDNVATAAGMLAVELHRKAIGGVTKPN